jgi:hypothetical protein
VDLAVLAALAAGVGEVDAAAGAAALAARAAVGGTGDRAAKLAALAAFADDPGILAVASLADQALVAFCLQAAGYSAAGARTDPHRRAAGAAGPPAVGVSAVQVRP